MIFSVIVLTGYALLLGVSFLVDQHSYSMYSWLINALPVVIFVAILGIVSAVLPGGRWG